MKILQKLLEILHYKISVATSALSKIVIMDATL
jgi:hypothetical protein